MQVGLDLIAPSKIDMKITRVLMYISLLIGLIVLLTFSYSRVIDGFVTIQSSKPIPRFVVTPPIVPKRPSPSTNSNGGLVSIS
jgi:hypothetical protein